VARAGCLEDAAHALLSVGEDMKTELREVEVPVVLVV
jgi:hypothetical protein